MTDETDQTTSGATSAVTAAAVVLAAVVGAASGAEPTASSLDPLLVGLVAAGATLTVGRAGWWAPVPALLVGTVALGLPWSVASLVGLGLGVAGQRWPRLEVARPLLAAGAVAAVLGLPDVGPFGTPSIVALVVLGPGVVVGARRWLEALPAGRTGSPRARRIALAAVAGVALGYVGLLAWAGRDLERGADQVDAAVDRAADGDSVGAAADLEDARDRFARAHRLLGGWWSRPLSAVPVASQHRRTLDAVAVEGVELVDAATPTLELASLEDLRAGDGRFDLRRMTALPEPLASTASVIRSSRERLVGLDTDWLAPPVTRRLASLDRDLVGAADDADEAAAALRVVPGLLGADGPRRYFVAFVTPAELRGSGGFVGSYAEVTAEDGRVELAESGSISKAEAALPRRGVTLSGPRDYLKRYGRYRPGRLLRDVTLSPHFPYVGEVVREVYDETGRPLDGVISIDPIAVAALLELTGPVEVAGLDHPIGPDDAAEFLLEGSYAELPDSAAQNRVLADLVEVTFDRLLARDLPGPTRLAEVLGPATREGRIRLWSPVPAEQRFFTRLGATGAFPAPQAGHDFMALSAQNAGNNKLDVYQARRVAYDVRIDAGGRVRATVQVAIRNDVPMDRDLPDFVTGNRQGDPRGTNATRLSLHTPHRLLRTRVDGEDVGIDPGEEAGFQAYAVLVRVPPGGQVVVTFDLEGRLAPDAGYTLDLAPQPTVHGDVLSVEVRSPAGQATWGPEDVLGERRLELAPRP